MTDLIACLSSGKGTWGHVNRLISDGEWGKIFLITNDERTCELCIEANDDDHVYEFGEGPLPPIHPNDRCTPLPVLKNRALERDIVGSTQTYREWARENGVGQSDDGGLFDSPGAPAPSTEEE